MEQNEESSPLLRLSSLPGPVVPVTGILGTGPSSSTIFNPAHTRPVRPPAILEGDISFHGPCFRRPEAPPKEDVFRQQHGDSVVLDEKAPAASGSNLRRTEYEASTVLPRMAEALALDTGDDIVLYPKTAQHAGETGQAASSSRDSIEAAIQEMLALHRSLKNTDPRYWVEAGVDADLVGVDAPESKPVAAGAILPAPSRVSAETSNEPGGRDGFVHETQDLEDVDDDSAMQY